jgi:hypothetical protein
MAYNEHLADRIRARLAGLPNIEEKKMMGGLTFMYNGKMCVGIIKDDLMCRIDRGRITAANTGQARVKGKSIRSPASQFPLFPRQGIENILVIEGRIPFDPVTALVFGVE